MPEIPIIELLVICIEGVFVFCFKIACDVILLCCITAFTFYRIGIFSHLVYKLPEPFYKFIQIPSCRERLSATFKRENTLSADKHSDFRFVSSFEESIFDCKDAYITNPSLFHHFFFPFSILR